MKIAPPPAPTQEDINKEVLVSLAAVKADLTKRWAGNNEPCQVVWKFLPPTKFPAYAEQIQQFTQEIISEAGWRVQPTDHGPMLSSPTTAKPGKSKNFPSPQQLLKELNAKYKPGIQQVLANIGAHLKENYKGKEVVIAMDRAPGYFVTRAVTEALAAQNWDVKQQPSQGEGVALVVKEKVLKFDRPTFD